MSCYDEQMCKVLSRRAGDWLLTHRWPRTTAFVGIAVGLLTAYLLSIGLLSIGVRTMPGRFALNALGGYAVFVLFLGLWLHRISPMPAKSLLSDRDQRVRTEVPGDSEFDDMLNDSIQNAIEHSGRQAENALAFLIMVAILGFLFIGCHFVFHAPWYLGKLMVDGGRIEHPSTPRGNPLGFLFLPISQSWPVAVLLVVHYATIGAAIQSLMSGG